METEILNLAKQLVRQGKKPTVALIRAKLSRRVAMPLIIQTLQRFDSLSAVEDQEPEHAEQMGLAVPENNEQDILTQLSHLRDEISTLKQQVADLTRQQATLGKSGKEQ